MAIVILALLAAVLVAGVIAVVHSAKHAVIGYEDDSGFHEGIDPRAENAFSHDVSAVNHDICSQLATEASLARPILNISSDPVETSSV